MYVRTYGSTSATVVVYTVPYPNRTVFLQWLCYCASIITSPKPPPLGRTKIFPTPPPRGGVEPERFLAHGDAV